MSKKCPGPSRGVQKVLKRCRKSARGCSRRLFRYFFDTFSIHPQGNLRMGILRIKEVSQAGINAPGPMAWAGIDGPARDGPGRPWLECQNASENRSFGGSRRHCRLLGEKCCTTVGSRAPQTPSGLVSDHYPHVFLKSPTKS